ncbi:MAG TPA: ribosomal protein S18-alanine N-acetyltransferase [Gemmatimonadales bacterium]
MAAVHAIERAVFGDPWSARDFDDSVAARVPFFVALADGEIAGYVIAHYAADEGEILNLAVAPEQRRRGLGRALARRALAALAERDVREVYLEVRVSNAAAHALYEGLGFKKVGRRAGYYRRPAEDAVVLRAAILADGGDA